ncbi:uncharacterized protein LOC119992168 isoform X2 [Tripterygium wilfordii]|nr:uncharacterized protein LOC119992168 isoform X2 [Tripterygium wilfordii]
MSVYGGPLGTKNPRAKEKLPGWAAFDHKQRQKQDIGPEVAEDPYPPMPTTQGPIRPCKNLVKNNDFSVRPFASVLLPSVELPTLTEDKKLAGVGDSSARQRNEAVEERSQDAVFEKLKELHGWADDSLIGDVMTAVDNDFDKASILLKGMVSTAKTGESAETNKSKQQFTSDHVLSAKKTDNRVFFGETVDLADMSSILEGLGNYCEDLGYVDASGRERLSDVAAAGDILESIKWYLNNIPVEPEWKEDDVYLRHRKDALRMMRSASQHSRAATNAFIRGDHDAAQQHSSKAREKWSAAERLNAEAAKQILSIRNSQNDMWKLDLHGLHATEAVQALKERLQKIEMHTSTNRLVLPDRAKSKTSFEHASSLESFRYMAAETLGEQHTTIRKRPIYLQVITGIGNHSRGEAALPTAVRNFLNENG